MMIITITLHTFMGWIQNNLLVICEFQIISWKKDDLQILEPTSTVVVIQHN